MADDKIEIELIVDGKPVRSTLKQLGKAIDKDGSKAGNRFGDKFGKGFKSQTGKLVGTAVAAGAAIGAALFGRASIKAAIVQQDAVNRLNSSLRSAGDFSEKASQDLQSFASSLQSTTRFGDETILNNIALAKSFGATNKQAKLVASASADLAAELGIDLQSATRNVAKTLGGYAGELGETIPALKNLTQEQLRAGKGVELLAERFKGAAGRDVQTFSGRLDQLANIFGDFQEQIGSFVTDSKSIRAVISVISKTFSKLTTSLSEVQGDPFKDFINGAIEFAIGFTDLIIAPLERGVQAFNFFRNVFALGIQALIGGIITGVQKVTGLFAKFGIAKELNESLLEAKEVASKAFDEIADNTAKSFAAFDGTPFSDAGKKAVQDFQQGFQQEVAAAEKQTFNPTVDQETGEVKPIGPTADQIAKTAADLGTVNSFYDDFFNRLKVSYAVNDKSLADSFKAASDGAKKTGLSVKAAQIDILRNSQKVLVTGLGRAFANVGATLANGGNAFKAFGQAVVGALADVASSAGDTFIQLGIARAASSYGLDATAYTMISAGAALKVLGGFLGAKSGGTSGGGAAGAGIAGGGVANVPEAGGGEDLFTEEEELTAVARGTTVNLTVQGDILDSNDTPRRLAELLNAGFETEDVQLNQFAGAR